MAMIRIPNANALVARARALAPNPTSPRTRPSSSIPKGVLHLWASAMALASGYRRASIRICIIANSASATALLGPGQWAVTMSWEPQ